MESLKVPVLSLRADDRIKVGLERYERVMRIDDREHEAVTEAVVVTRALLAGREQSDFLRRVRAQPGHSAPSRCTNQVASSL